MDNMSKTDQHQIYEYACTSTLYYGSYDQTRPNGFLANQHRIYDILARCSCVLTELTESSDWSRKRLPNLLRTHRVVFLIYQEIL